MRGSKFNAPSTDEVANVLFGDQFQPTDIVLYRRNDQLTKVAENHRCYDAHCNIKINKSIITCAHPNERCVKISKKN